MALVTCPSCTLEVESDAGSCPGCGSDLAETLNLELDSPQRLEFLPGQSFAERYTIIEKIGAGGMGVVYKAIDEAVHAEVALKLILPGLSAIPRFSERFRREARVTRQVTHPNVCRVHDIGEHNAILYLSMEWIDGETLEQLLRKTGALSEGRALQIAQKIALALEAAHAEGVVHRDLKPGNVMIDARGHVHVMDFGLASEEGADSLSRPGTVVGTLPYMSPEQRRGEHLDSRTDLYSLGLILREMLTGMRADPQTVAGELSSGVNPAIVPVLERSLASRETRFASATAVEAALRELLEDPAISVVSGDSGRSTPPSAARVWMPRVAAWIGLLVVASVVAYVFWPEISTDVPRIQDSRARDFYERGLQRLYEDLETVRGLDSARQMFVRALDYEPNSALIMARLGEVYWRRYEKEPSDASRGEAQKWLTQAAAIEPSLAELHNARGFGDLQAGEFETAKAEFERALELRPGFADAWANLAFAHQNLGGYAEGLEALDRAMELEPGSFRMFLYRGNLHWHFGEGAEAAKNYERATELKSDSAMAWSNLGGTMLYLGRFDEAIDACTQSIEAEDNSSARSNLGTALYLQGNYEASVEHNRRAAELEPTYPPFWGNLGDSLWALERMDEARQAFAEAARLARERVDRDPLDAWTRMRLAQYCALAGDGECALEHSGAAMEMQPDNTTFVLKMALIQCVLQEDDESLDWLDRAVKLGASKAQIDGYPQFSRLRDNPRFRAIVELAS
jgi:serine/threonine protein kinase